MVWEIALGNLIVTLWSLSKGSVLGVTLAIGIYKLAAHYHWWRVGKLRYAVLTLWLLVLPLGCGTVWALFAVQGAANEVIASETGNTARVFGDRVGEPLLLLAAGAAGAHAGAGLREGDMRVSMSVLHAARETIANQLDVLYAEMVAGVEAKDEGFARSYRVWALDQAYDSMISRPADERLAEVDQVLRALDQRKDDEGTIGGGEIAEVLGDKYLRPQIHGFAQSLFGGLRMQLYFLMFVLVLLPLLASRFFGRSRAGADVAVGGH